MKKVFFTVLLAGIVAFSAQAQLQVGAKVGINLASNPVMWKAMNLKVPWASFLEYRCA